nr:hypothetical protein HK105_002002 [Polyrhizophydium stewartii]
MRTNAMRSADVRTSSRWFRQSGSRRDREVLLAKGIEAAQRSGKVELTGDLLANYIKALVSKHSEGIVTDASKDILNQLLRTTYEETPARWFGKPTLAAVGEALALNPQRAEIAHAVGQLAAFVLKKTQGVRVDPTALASVVKIDSAEAAVPPPAVEIESDNETASDYGLDYIDESGPSQVVTEADLAAEAAANFKEVQARWHRAWGMLINNRRLMAPKAAGQPCTRLAAFAARMRLRMLMR